MKKKHLYIVTIIVLLVISIYQYFNREGVCAQKVNHDFATNNIELPKLTSNRSQQIIHHLAYTVSYNPKWKIPNWVAYELTRGETYGDVPRKKKFSPDPLVKGYRVQHSDYSNSGYDRGHMAPAADMKWAEQAMRESFYMTNVCPQNQSLNRGDWNDLEELARDWARKYESIYRSC